MFHMCVEYCTLYYWATQLTDKYSFVLVRRKKCELWSHAHESYIYINTFPRQNRRFAGRETMFPFYEATLVDITCAYLMSPPPTRVEKDYPNHAHHLRQPQSQSVTTRRPCFFNQPMLNFIKCAVRKMAINFTTFTRLLWFWFNDLLLSTIICKLI